MASPFGRPPRKTSKQRNKGNNSSHSGSSSPARSHEAGPFMSPSLSKSASFQMMNVSISVDIMEGLSMECGKSSKGQGPLGSMPVNAYISCMKNVSKSRQIATHVPSLPLAVPAANFGDKLHNFLVRWPADFDPHGDALSTFKLSRLMKKDSYCDYDSYGSGIQSGYVPQEIELSIGIMRSSEMMNLGKANLVITGNETEELYIDIPIAPEKETTGKSKVDGTSPSPLKRTSSKLFGKSRKEKGPMKPQSFNADSRRKYYFNEHSMIRLQVQISPDTESDESSFDDHHEAQKEMALIDKKHISAKSESTSVSLTNNSASHSKDSLFESHSKMSTPYVKDLSSALGSLASGSHESSSGEDRYVVKIDSSLSTNPTTETHHSAHYEDYVQNHQHCNPNQRKNSFVSMDEMQHEMGRIQVSPAVPAKAHAQRHSLSHHLPRSASRSRGARGVVENHSYSQSEIEPTHQPPHRQRSSSRTRRAFGQEVPNLTQHSIPMARSSSRPRDSAPIARSSSRPRDSVPIARSLSRTRDSRRVSEQHDYRRAFSEDVPPHSQSHAQVNSRTPPRRLTPLRTRREPDSSGYDNAPLYSPMNGKMGHNKHQDEHNSSYRHNLHYQDHPHVETYNDAPVPLHSRNPHEYSHEEYDEDVENRQVYANKNHQERRKPRRKHSSKVQAREQQETENTEESPMEWLYDKIVGKQASLDETTVRNNKTKSSPRNSYKKKPRRNGEENHGKSHEARDQYGSRYRRSETPTRTRTMRV
eukprot:CAMPEP_0194074276 /NCGR_PEP_ID=MMETSP0149-20130528/1428_1 /TAXON_ID=122233 /ORGANISM="Chaetoceros debilis, Strain MM31A-1" /LENGTH=757 /DNA_ID=CAMNT_0038754419 /DNA_START=23 /DNA_END=2296 /DNA_ORIENTATION=-